MVFSAGDGDESAFDPIIDKDKADPWLKSVKKEAKLLMQKLGPNCDKLNQIMRKEERVIALQTYIAETRINIVSAMRSTENLTISGIFDDDQRLDILSCWPSDDNNGHDTNLEVNTHTKRAL